MRDSSSNKHKRQLESFDEFAPEYFKYLTDCLSSGSPACLAKVLGIYQVYPHTIPFESIVSVHPVGCGYGLICQRFYCISVVGLMIGLCKTPKRWQRNKNGS